VSAHLSGFIHDYPFFIWGFFGASVANFLRLFAFVGQKNAQRSAVLGDYLYWVEFAVFPLLGGIFASAYGEASISYPHILPFHLGMSAPAIMKLMAGASRHGNEPTN